MNAGCIDALCNFALVVYRNSTIFFCVFPASAHADIHCRYAVSQLLLSLLLIL